MSVSDATILDELVAFAQDETGQWLLPFRGLVSARQYRHLYRKMRSLAAPGARVLDWGVATGHFSYFLMRAGYDAVGYSLEDLTFVPLRREPAYRFVRGSVRQPVALPFRAASFDVVVSVGVLEHVRETGGDEVASLREIHRVLRPGGAFIAYHLPQSTSWVELVARATPGKHAHRFRYDRRAIAEMIAAAGLRLEDVGRYAFLPRNVWGRAPRTIRNSRLVATAWDGLDAILGRVLAPSCTYYWAVARRAGGGEDDPPPGGGGR